MNHIVLNSFCNFIKLLTSHLSLLTLYTFEACSLYCLLLASLRRDQCNKRPEICEIFQGFWLGACRICP